MDSKISESSSFLTLIRERRKNNKKRKENKEKTPQEKRENVKKWCTFYRRNINLYVSRHLQINLHPFQHIVLYLMGVSQVFFAICTRGLSKTWLCGAFAVAKAMLYPYSEIHITASTLHQAKQMIQKIQIELCGKLSPILKYYYEQDLIKIKISKEEIYVKFYFGDDKNLPTSTIFVDVADESSRGARSTLTIYEECRLLKKGIIDSVFEPMGHPRQAKYITLPEYAGDPRWIEECQSIYITSARFKNEWFWRTFKNVISECIMNKHIEYNFFAADIFLAIKYGLKTKSDFLKYKKNMNELDFRMEVLNEMLGEAENAFFTREMFKQNQVIKKAFTPPTIQSIIGKVDLKNRPKKENEYRLLFIDYAFANTTSASENDNSIIGCMSIFYKGNRCVRTVDYLTTHPASDSFGMERKIRELFWDYQCDYIIQDTRSGGEIFYNNLTQEWQHPERSKEEWNSHGFTVCEELDLQLVPKAKLDDLRARTVDPQAIPCIIPIIGTPELNSIMWLDLQKILRNGDINFLIEDIDYKTQLEEEKGYFNMTSEEKADKLLPYVETMFLIAEAVNLSQEWRDGKVKLSEPRSGTKDRIVALSYGSYIATLLENKLNKQSQEDEFDLNDWSFLAGI